MVRQIWWILFSYVARGELWLLPVVFAALILDPPRYFPLLLSCPVLGCAVLIGMQLHCQFRAPASRLAPGFAGSHFIVAAILIGALLGVSFWAQAQATGSLAIAATYSAALILSGVAAGAPSGGWGVPLQAGTVRGIGAVMVLAFGTMLTPTAFWVAGRMPSFNHPLMAAVWLAVAVFSFFNLKRILADLSSGEFLPCASDCSEQTSWSWTAFANKMSATSDRLLEDGAALRRVDSFADRVRRTRAGTFRSGGAFGTLFYILFFAIIFIIIPMLYSQPIKPESLLSSAFILGVTLLISPVFNWRMRLRAAPIEMLRPDSRATQLRQWAAAFLWDVVPKIAVVACMAAIAANLQPDLSVAWRSVPLYCAAILPIALVVTIAFGAMAVMARHLWVVAAWSTAATLGVIFLGSTVQSQRAVENFLLSPPGLALSISLLVAISLTAIFWSWRHWQNFEFGRQA